ncbi:hypothetical protein FHS89_001979 [Rubricella aquisinus]|uniref:Cell division and transport-associated protein TolA n=1 Tax=Rubricella aquisinus TaxID=2028108 RepID=A0A840WLM9_9RHOB|nr:hypothetical protein [Rubricella aquisinus]MBB5515959.1 hypothetical protein [Rubricella aquisinus]
MRTGLAISVALHGGLILFAVFDGMFNAPPLDEDLIEVSEVDILSEAQFDALTSSAPEFVPTEMLALSTPEESIQDANTDEVETEVEVTDISGPEDPSEADAQADLSDIRTRPTVTANVNTVDLAQRLPQQNDLAMVRPMAQAAPTSRPTLNRPTMSPAAPPRQAPRITTRSNPRPPEDVRRADERQEEVAQGETPTETPVQEQDATAPEESSDQIVPEITDTDEAPAPETTEEFADVDNTTTAPVAAAPPPARPQSVVEAAEADQPADPEPAPAAQTETAQSAPVGAPLTIGEIDGFKAAIRQYWNLAILDGLPNSDELIVTVSFRLAQDGTVVNGEVRAVTPANPQGAFARAFQAAQRAVLQASFRGDIRLPVEKYARWQEVEITFDPSTQQIGF